MTRVNEWQWRVPGKNNFEKHSLKYDCEFLCGGIDTYSEGVRERGRERETESVGECV